MADRLHLQRKHRQMLESLLRKHLPDVEVWAYGSRVTGRSHDGSDLDLVLRGPELGKIPIAQLADFEEAVRESNIPFLVEARDWARLPERFHAEIERRHVRLVNSPTSTTKHDWLYRPSFPVHWKRRPLHSMAQWVNGLAFRKMQFSSTGRPVIKIAEIKGGISGQTKFTEQVFDDSVRVRHGDLLFAWSGQPESSINAFWWNGMEGWLNQHVFRVTPCEGIDRKFLFYLLRYLRPQFVAIAHNKQTTGLGHVTKQDLERIQAAAPALKEQRTITRVLGTLDDKIELNRRMNQTMEATAHSLFKSWFVDFDQVRAKRAQGESQDVPVEWRTGTLAEVAVARRQNVAPADCGAETPYIGLEHMPRRSIALESWGTAEGVKSAKSRFEKGDILFGKLRPYFHKVGIAPVDGVCSTDIVVIAPKSPEWSAFVSATVSSDPFVSYTDQTSTGTRMPRTSWKTMGQFPICIPPDQLALAYQEAMQPILARIVTNIHLSRTLAQIRDILLPKLISGEIRIADAEKGFQAVV